MAPPQRFYPTSWGFHPSGGCTAQLFNQGVRPGVSGARRSARRERSPDGRPDPRAIPSAVLSCPVSAVTASGSPGHRSAHRARLSCRRRSRPHPRRTIPRRTTSRPRRTSARRRRSGGPRGARRSARPRMTNPRPRPTSCCSYRRRSRRRTRTDGPIPAELVLAPGADHRAYERHCDHRQDDEEEHDVTLLPVPPKRPPWAPRLVREAGMPGRLTCQSRVEEVQSLSAGWRA